MGAVLVLFFLRSLFGISFGSPGVDAIIGSAAALILIPTEVAYRRKQKNRRR
jgi:gas vesicle protein